ncbi:MAG: FAD-dependent oxidoreductase [Patescibacteria group bacterium]|nr:FAD-dependent oxidoreductase [Patescibacteria group bacterium]
MNEELNRVETDVLVVGAGAAGVTAAIAAARNGAKTLVVEYQGFLGGLSATMPWLGFHDRDYRQVVKGLAAEFVARLQQLGAASEYCLDPKCSSAVSLDNHAWKCVAMDLAREAGVDILLHAHVVDTLREGDRIAGVVVEHKSGRQRIYARVVIDCSGDGDVAARGGCAWEKGRTADGLVQSPSLAVRLGGVDRERFLEGYRNPALAPREWLLPFPDLWEKMLGRLDRTPVVLIGGYAPLLEQARRAGDLCIPQSRIVGVKLHRPDQFMTVMNRVLGLDPTSVASVTDAYRNVYHQVLPTLAFFRKYVPGFAAAHLLEVAPMLGIRESRRIVGDYMLTADDLVEGRQFEDSVAMGGYHIDIHRPTGTWVESRNVRAYGIPLRSLIVRGVEGLLVAGKCLSATHEAVASTRVIPICMAQGQAAGTAAAMAVRRGVDVRALPVDELQDVLVRQGAEIGRTVGEPDWRAIEEIGQLPFDEPPSPGEGDEASREEAAWVR